MLRNGITNNSNRYILSIVLFVHGAAITARYSARVARLTLHQEGPAFFNSFREVKLISLVWFKGKSTGSSRQDCLPAFFSGRSGLLPLLEQSVLMVEQKVEHRRRIKLERSRFFIDERLHDSRLDLFI